ncbi:thiamine pyrophosphate-binding protein [Mumia zhuanghuii]|uniref:Thiamine pyrophosphate-binding protein n=2 Tax=Mumia TaxID=1546255 RepID=A0ABW1QHX1_9ACTN|nr:MULTISPECIES: thiamine pyrophosphate-binding protein [Mumia]KAA1418227.1 thiamine pyrophosphate-binding protein [Mumia zhuanghuii]
MTTYDAALAGQLHEHEVEVVYGLIGDANLFFVDHWVNKVGGRYIGAAHEANAVMMAAGHARATGAVGVATVTHGPGLTNVVTALVECAKSSIPVLVIAGRTSDQRRHAPQKLVQRPLVEATGAGFEVARAADTLDADLAHAFWRARAERRPIVLEVPIDLMGQEVPEQTGRGARPMALTRSAPAPGAIDTALGIVMSSRRPIVLAGQGALHAREPLVRLAAMLGAPLACTAQAKDLFAGEPAHLGIFGTLSTAAAQDVIADSDCILAFGASITPETSDKGGLLEGRTLIQCDDDAAAIGRYVLPDAAIVGDAAATAEELVRWLEEAEATPSAFAARAAARLAEPARRVAAPGRAGTVDLQEVFRHLDEILPNERTVVVDVGRFALHALRVMTAPDARSWMWAGAGFASIGLATGMAIGAAASRPDRPTVLLVGDGGFALGGLNEFTTAVSHGLDLVCVVANDGSYGAEHVQFTGRGLDPALSLLTWPDFAAVASALGGDGVTIRTSEELSTIGDVIARRTRPLLIDVRLDPDRVTSFE